MRTTNKKTQTMVLGAVMTALVVVFQLLATFTAIFGPFSTAIALIPIVIGAAICGTAMGGWLGFVFGVVVLASGGANLFLAFDVFGTFATVLVKGIACGFAAGFAYKLFAKINRYVAVFAAALICPVVNTGVFMLGSVLFFLDSVSEIAAAIGMDGTGIGVFWAMAMGNFLFEIGMNLVLSPVIVRLLDLRKKH